MWLAIFRSGADSPSKVCQPLHGAPHHHLQTGVAVAIINGHESTVGDIVCVSPQERSSESVRPPSLSTSATMA